MPPPGVSISDEVRGVLTARAEALQRSLAAAAQAWTDHPERTRYLPDVEVFWKSADWALRHDELYDVKQADWAREQLEEGERRLSDLGRDEKPWLARTGLVVRGYRSRIDDSVQPFGMVVPPSFHPNLPHRWRLDCWFHGRGEKLTELDFIHQRMTSPGEFTPPDTLVLHPYGRYCNGSRFAGETDFFEALEVVKRDYRIDNDRMVVRGFSLGGAACWHLAAHHAAQWCAAAPGAGFSETEEFLTGFQGERLQPPPWERKLWALHDTTAVAANFHNLPLVAYSGAKDRQKQAAEAMARALQVEGLALTHIIGPDTGHSYESAARAEIDRRINALADAGRRDAPAEVIVTHTLRHHAGRHVRLDGLDEHWTPARLTFLSRGSGQYEAHLTNISAFTIDLPPGQARRAPGEPGTLTLKEIIDGRETRHTNLPLGDAASDGSLTASFHRHNGQWLAGPPPADGLRKKHGLQGPIDDAFMDRFLFVRPTGAPAHERPGAWARAELDRALEQWRRQFRGDARIKNDTEVTDEDIRTSHLVLWGDPSSNALLARVAPSLAIAWNTTTIQAGDRSFPAASHALIAIQPNPLNSQKYLVLNSGFTFREYDQLNNARQTPKLPDWAVIDLDTPPDSRHPGKIAAADFFGERWELKPAGP